MTLLLISLSGVLLTGCKEKFPREHEFRNYLKEQHQISVDQIKDKHIFMVLQAGFCGSCTRENLDFIDSIKCKNKYVMVSNHYRGIAIDYLQKHSKAMLLIDAGFNLEEYGLRLGNDVLLEVENGAINQWSWVNHYTLNKLRARYY